MCRTAAGSNTSWSSVLAAHPSSRVARCNNTAWPQAVSAASSCNGDGHGGLAYSRRRRRDMGAISVCSSTGLFYFHNPHNPSHHAVEYRYPPRPNMAGCDNPAGGAPMRCGLSMAVSWPHWRGGTGGEALERKTSQARYSTALSASLRKNDAEDAQHHLCTVTAKRCGVSPFRKRPSNNRRIPSLVGCFTFFSPSETDR